MDDSEGDCDDEQLKEAMKCRCCIASQRSGRQIRGKREGRHMTVDRQDSRRELQKCVASDQDIFTAAETSASTLHTAGTLKVHPMHRRTLLDSIASTTFRSMPLGSSSDTSVPIPSATQTDLL